MKNTTPNSYTSDLAMKIVSDAAAGAIAPGGAIAVQVERSVGEVIEIAPGKAGEEEKRKEVDGEVRPVAVVSEEEGRAMSLTPKQCVAIVKLTSGESKSKTAKAAGVERMTLYRWMKHDPAFKAALNGWVEDVKSTSKAQMVSAIPDAMRAVIGAIRGGDARLAWKLLESQGVTEEVATGPTDVEELRQIEAVEQKRKEIERKRVESRLEMDELNSSLGEII